MPETHSSPPSFSPADMAQLVGPNSRRVSEERQPQKGDIVTIEGKEYELTRVMRTRYDRDVQDYVEEPYTYRTYYSHTDHETGMNGPGWDSRWSLLDDDIAYRRHGRTFTQEQVEEPYKFMPDVTLFLLVPANSSPQTL